MLKEIRMPDLSTTGSEINVMKWLVAVGDKVKRGDILMQVETDKAVMDVESYLAGEIAELCVREEDAVNEGDVICRINC